MLENLKMLLNISDNTKDDLLTFLIEQAREEAMAYTHLDCVDELSTIILRMCVYNYNRLGTEGLDSEGQSGVSFAYSADYPEPIVRALKAKRKLITL